MIKLTDEMIRDVSESTSTYLKGRQYYMANRVVGLQYSEGNNVFSALVQGSQPYGVRVAFNTRGNFVDAHCSCPAYDRYWGNCKHIVATLLTIKERIKGGEFTKAASEQHIKNILNFYRSKASGEKTPLTMEITLEIEGGDRGGKGRRSYVSLNIGESKLYVVKNMREFIKKVHGKEGLAFGKNFTYDPYIHRFQEEDQRILNLIQEIYEQEEYIQSGSYRNFYGSFFDKKRVLLSEILLKRFLHMIKEGNFLEEKRFKLIIFDQPVDLPLIYEGDLPIVFHLDKNQGDIHLEISHGGQLIPLVSDGEFFYTGRGICQVSPYQRENLLPFYHVLTGDKRGLISIGKRDQEEFLSEVYPIMKRLGTVKMSKGVEDSLQDAQLKTEIYFDKEGNRVIADIAFKYNDVTLNPFATQKKAKGKEGQVVIRDLEGEGRVNHFFEKYEFKVKEGRVYLEDEEKIFQLLYEDMKVLQSLGEVYYSEAFKSMEIRQPPRVKGGIRLNPEENFLDFHFEVEDVEENELIHLLKSLRQKKKFYRLKDGSFIPLDSPELENLDGLFVNLDLNLNDFRGKHIQIPRFRAMYAEDFLREKKMGFIKPNKSLKKFIEEIKEFEDGDAPIPEELASVLRDYQKMGFQWLKSLSRYGLGGILADDMGLGKTLQVLSYLLSEKKAGKEKPALIVAPTSLVYNWMAEAEKFTPSLRIQAIVGTKGERREKLENLEAMDVLVTSYPLIRRDIELYEGLHFSACILDEAQHIKNPLSQNAKSVKDIRAEHRFALTGTPIENSLTELWSIFDFIMPGYLFSANKFQNRFEKPIIREQDPDATKELARQIGPFILRRLKRDVLKELPEKIENQVVAELTPEQKKIYLAYLKEIKGEIEEEIQTKGFEKSQIKILAALTRLRQICCHPSLFLEHYKGESGKFELLKEVMENGLGGGHRILLFSQFTSMLQMIRRYLEQQGTSYFYLEGSTPLEERAYMVKAFNEGKADLFLISLKAGGTGLNLTGADMVIHYDPWWNPAVEEQATDRAYRIGQKNPVHVMKLITKGTIEEKIFKLQEKKKKMIDTVIQPGETLLGKMSKEELMELFQG